MNSTTTGWKQCSEGQTAEGQGWEGKTRLEGGVLRPGLSREMLLKRRPQAQEPAALERAFQAEKEQIKISSAGKGLACSKVVSEQRGEDISSHLGGQQRPCEELGVRSRNEGSQGMVLSTSGM